MSSICFLFIIIFIIGLLFYAKYNNPKYNEALTNNNTSRCPNLLIQKGSRFYLHNSKLAQVPGVNPVEFDNLEDYTEFLDWQRSQGIRCPVLYLQETYDAQGIKVYKTRPSVSEPQAGLSSISSPLAYPNHTLLLDDTSDNPNSYTAEDLSPPLDNIDKQSQSTVSPDPMDPNWGGSKYTQSLIDKGYYKDNEVQLTIT
jgi:hypothetical protein